MSDYLNGDKPLMVAEGLRLQAYVRSLFGSGAPVFHKALWFGLSKWGVDGTTAEDLLEHHYNEVTEEEAEDGALTTMPRCMTFGEYVRTIADTIGYDVVITDVWNWVHGHVDCVDSLGEDYDYAFTWFLWNLAELLGEFDEHLLMMEVEVIP